MIFYLHRNLPENAVLSINDDVGMNAGDSLLGGTVIVNGNTSGYAGIRMNHGTIIINGNTGGYLGDRMSGGTLTVNGNARGYTGSGMQGGMLSIGGNVESFATSAFSPENLGTILWKGVTIWKKGKFTEEGKRMSDNNDIPEI